MKEMTSPHNKVAGVVRRAIKKYTKETLLSEIGDDTILREKLLSEEVRSLRLYSNFITRTFGSSHTKPIDMSCRSGGISCGTNTLEKSYLEKTRRTANSPKREAIFRRSVWR
jgi:hypothetical protein